jgi:hypothetical protein
MVNFPKNWQEINRPPGTVERRLAWNVSPGTPIPRPKEHTIHPKPGESTKSP